ncbi:MAG: tetratricopeptide repeat protein [Clostridia bacterium]|nr:tetratricopeptide repeat protein [Clostridia bacterium]
MIDGTTFAPVPQQRIRDKVDECMSRKDYAGVEKVLSYWLQEAEAGQDLRGRLMILNEMVGHYRKTGEREKAHLRADDALALLSSLEYENAISGATTYVNIGTAFNAFGENDAALPLFEHARQIYENSAGTDPQLLGGLYNNMGLTYTALGRYEEALAVFHKALDTMKHVPGGSLDAAITCLNMADTKEAQLGMEEAESEIFMLLERAESCLTDSSFPKDGYYAYVCERCAPVFEYYGWFAAANRLKQEAADIYERS